MAASRAMQGLEAAEYKLITAGVSKKDWIYIGANADYPPETPFDHRVGGFGCNRDWIEDQIRRYPNNFYTVVDCREIENVMQYVKGYHCYIKETDTFIEGEAGMKVLVEEAIRNHRTGICNCIRIEA